jgi:hypothetical protein
MISLHCKLKVLSGTLGGVEFALQPGDTVFRVGPQRDLTEGVVGETLASAENTYYIPDERIQASFVLRIKLVADRPQLAWMEQTVDEPGTFEDEPSNRPFAAAGLHLAWREAHEVWSSEVLDFRPPQRALQVRTPLVTRVRRQTSSKPFWVVAAIAAVAIVMGAGYWYRHHFVPETRVRGLIGSLAGAPVDYDVVYGNDGRLYAFADKAIGVAWGRRASERLRRRDDVYLERTQEASRLGQRLTAAGLDYVVIRLRDPGEPEVVLGGDQIVTDSVKRRVNEVLGEAAPYARLIKVESIGDARLIAIARDRLRLMGISTRVDMTGARSSISNDVFLDDAALHAMSRYADEFGDYWGRRRVAINIRLWDDLLKGRSYQYSPGQLLSVGEGRWDALRSVPKGKP